MTAKGPLWLGVIVLAILTGSPVQAETVSDEANCKSIAAGVKHGEVLLDVCLWSFSARETLPDLLVEQTTKREKEYAHTDQWDTIDEITCSLRYENGTVQYLNVKANGKPITLSKGGIEGSWSTGEYSAILVSILQADQGPHFQFTGQKKEGGSELLEFHYRVSYKSNRTFSLRVSPTAATYPGFVGELWIDAQTHKLFRLERRTEDIDQGFPITYVNTSIQYQEVALRDGSNRLLPVKSQEFSCLRGGECLRNTIRFENWRKFGAEHHIDVSGDTPNASETNGSSSPK
jgi:hypothetical protein